MQYELLQIDGVAEEGERGGRWVWPGGPAKFHDGVNFEGTEEREWSRIDFREQSNVCPVVMYEVERPDLSSVGRKQYCGADRNIVVGDYI